METNNMGKKMPEHLLKQLIKAAEEGDIDAQLELGNLYEDGEQVERNYDEAFKWYEKAAKQGNAYAQFAMGDMYYDEFHKKKTNSIGVRWFKKAAAQGNEYAMEKLGDAYYHGGGVRRNYEEAVKWYKKAADYNLGWSIQRLGDMYYYGEGVEQSFDEAYKWYCKAEELNDFVGVIDIDIDGMYVNGEVPLKYHKKDLKKFKNNADKDWHACKRLGAMYHNGMGVKPNDKIARRWYMKMINTQDDPGRRMCDLANMYYYGEGINQDYKEAIKLYKKAANNGEVIARAEILEIWCKENTPKIDFRTAYKWIKYWAGEDVDIAQYNLGLIYLEGKYLKRNLKKALFWITKAAEQGYKPAQKKLAKIYK